MDPTKAKSIYRHSEKFGRILKLRIYLLIAILLIEKIVIFVKEKFRENKENKYVI